MANCKITSYDWVKTRLAQGIHSFLQDAGLEDGQDIEAIAALIERPKSPDLGDYAIPCFGFAKITKKPPQVFAAELADGLMQQKITGLVAAKPTAGFLNLSIDYALLSAEMIPQVIDGSFFRHAAKNSQNQDTRVMVEYSNPNTHKEFHIGHLRNVCLGDALCKFFRFAGFDLIAVNYLGDEGAHVAKCLWQVSQTEERPNEAASLWYGRQYVRANEQLNAAQGEEKAKIQAAISAVLSSIEKKSGPLYDLWVKSRQECVDDLKSIYDWLDVHFDHYFFESEVSENCQRIVDEWLAKGLFVEDQGAIGIHLEDEGLGFFMARKSDGTSLYITKDLELAKRKFEDYKIQRSIYVVGNEQKFHFKQLFRVLELMQFPHAKDCYHLGYAHVTLKSGKISSRLGNAYPLSALIELLEEHILPYLDKYRGTWTDEAISSTSKILAKAAIKYGMLQSDPQKQIVFDPEIWTSFEGNTGPYLLYSYSRAHSILVKNADAQLPHPNDLAEGDGLWQLLSSESEKRLLQLIYDFNAAVVGALDHYKPSILCNYLFELAKAFNQFYAVAPVMKAENPDLRRARTILAYTFTLVLKKGLALIGIETADRM